MSSAIELLRDEHAAIVRALAVLAEIDRHLAAGDPVDPQDASDVLDFLSGFGDACHHGKEEGLLFPALLDADATQSHKPIERLRREHTQGREWLTEMRDALSTRHHDPKAFHEAARRYTRLMLEHIDKENHVLFPMAARLLSAKQLAHLWRDFGSYENQVMGTGRHQALHGLLHRLQDRYPV